MTITAEDLWSVVELLLDEDYDNATKKSLIASQLGVEYEEPEPEEKWPIGSVMVRRADLGEPRSYDGAVWAPDGFQGKKGMRWKRVA